MTHFPSTQQISTRFVSLFLLIPSPASTWAVGGASYPPSRWRHSGQKCPCAPRARSCGDICEEEELSKFSQRRKKSFLPTRDENIHTQTLKIFQVSSQRNIACFSWFWGRAWSERFPTGPPKKTTMAARFAKGISLTSLLCLCCCVLAERKGMWRSHTGMERYGTVSCWVAPPSILISPPYYYCASVWVFFLNRDLTEITART